MAPTTLVCTDRPAWQPQVDGCETNRAQVLCVAATDQDDHLTTFSNYASQYVPTAAHQRLVGQVEIAAPGIDIYSSYMGCHRGAIAMNVARSGYRSEFGTSMSTPFVAGAAALVVSAFGYSGTDVRRICEGSVARLAGSCFWIPRCYRVPMKARLMEACPAFIAPQPLRSLGPPGLSPPLRAALPLLARLAGWQDGLSIRSLPQHTHVPYHAPGR